MISYALSHLVRVQIIMEKRECIEIFNAMIRGTPVDFQNKILPLISEYLTENNVENSSEMINLIAQNPQLAQQTMPNVVKYFCKKYNICEVQVLPDAYNANVVRTILYYE